MVLQVVVLTNQGNGGSHWHLMRQTNHKLVHIDDAKDWASMAFHQDRNVLVVAEPPVCIADWNGRNPLIFLGFIACPVGNLAALFHLLDVDNF